MKKFSFILIACLINSVAIAEGSNASIVKAERAFSSGNLALLAQLYKSNPNNITISYFYSKAMLLKNNTSFAEYFVANSPNSFMRNDMSHQLLAFYFNNNSFARFRTAFNRLPLPQASINEKCGYDLAGIAVHAGTKRLISNNWLTSNNIPGWCANLGASLYKQGVINNDQKNRMLYNLLAYDKADIANQTLRNLGSGRSSQYLVVNKVTALAKKDPDSAYAQMKQASLDSNTKNFLGSYLAMQFAIKHQFGNAKSLYDKYDSANLSDDEYEWLVRTYLYFGNYSDAINTINDMPETLRQKNVWSYWLAKSYAHSGNRDKAKSIFAKIPLDYSYYSMLSQAELGEVTEYKTNPSTKIDLEATDITKQAQLALTLYQLGKANNDQNLTNIATAEWNYTSKQADDDTELLSMSNLAHKNQLYDLSIYAANQMEARYISLSFPMPFSSAYSKYSRLFGVDPAYALAISRQESRFNYNVIAFDGGVGLMQIMPQTAVYIAQKSGSANCYRQSPECNIKLGSWYLGYLFGKFDKNLIYSTAAYNAGPTRPLRWQEQLGKLDNKVQIELIPIAITRDYVQKVISNKAVYDAEMEDRSSINLLKYINNLNTHNNSNQSDDGSDA